MKITVIGAGAIGNLVAGYLKIKGEDVSLVGHPASLAAIKDKGLLITGVRGDFQIDIDISPKLSGSVDLAILTTKTQDLENSLKSNLEFLKGAVVLTTQNGIQADNIVVKHIPKENIISSIVMFGSTYLEPGRVVHNFEGNWIIGKMFGPNTGQVNRVSEILKKAFPLAITEKIKGMKYLKIFVNANNCIAAILGISMQEAFGDLKVSRISMGIWNEGLKITNQAGIELESLPDFPLERLIKLTAMPLDEGAKIFSGIMANLSKEPLYGSILQSIKRGRASEIDYINGEFVKIARENNLAAPLNEKLVKMVHQVEQTNKFFSKEELINAAEGLYN